MTCELTGRACDCTSRPCPLREHSGSVAARGARAALRAGRDPREGARFAVRQVLNPSNPLSAVVADWFAAEAVPAVVARAARA